MITPSTKTLTKNFDPFRQYELQPMEFDGYDKEQVIKLALGSGRNRQLHEVDEIRSVNFIQGVRGWRLTPRGLEIYSFDLLESGVDFAKIQEIATNRLLGRSTAGDGPIEVISIGSGLLLSAGVLSATVTQFTDEQAQDAVGLIMIDTDTVDLIYDDATPDISAEVRKQMSIASDAAGIKLAGDAATPGNNQFYGTDNTGSKGFFALPNLINISTGIVAPATTPARIGDIYVDTAAAKVYMATGVASAADWTLLN